MPDRPLLRGVLLVGTFMAFACAAPSTEAPDKDAFRAGKADGDVPSERVCVALGAPATCDACRVAGWYEDGECDDFCRYRDADCDPVYGDDAMQWRCDTIREAALSCSGGGPVSASCLPEPGDGSSYEAALGCCGWRRDWCADLSEPDARFAPAIQWVRVPYRLRGIDAGTSGAHRVGAFAPHDFSPYVFAGALRQFDRDVRGCENRSYSSSRANAVAHYEHFLAERDPHASETYPAARILESFQDPENAAVFASVQDGGDDGSCDYADFYLFRADGTVVHMSYDYRAADADAASADGPGGIRYLTDEDLAVVNRMQEYGHNGGSSIGFWNESALEYDSLTTHARVHDASSYGCVDRGISADTAEALTRFEAHVDSAFHMFDYFADASEIEDEFPGFGADRTLIGDYVRDPSNRAVLSSEFTHEDRDYSESCLIYDFYVIRDNGTAVRFSVNQTD